MSRTNSLKDEEALLRASLAATTRCRVLPQGSSRKSDGNHFEEASCYTQSTESLKELCGLLDSTALRVERSSSSNGSIQSLPEGDHQHPCCNHDGITRSATFAPECVPIPGGSSVGCPFDSIPWHVMAKIFSTLELRERCIASMVCRRWHTLLTNGDFPMEDVAVLNIFEERVWEGTLAMNAGTRCRKQRPMTNQCCKYEQFPKFLAHCCDVTSIKLWYATAEFLQLTLERLRMSGIKMRSVDVYPYSEMIGLNILHQHLPSSSGMTIRPHGQDYFFNGLPLDSFPTFASLDSLHLDSINLGEDVKLPPALATLEWQNRNESQLRKFLPKLAELSNLEYLLIGHAEFVASDFNDFVQLLRRMPRLQYLLFKFSKMNELDYDSGSVGTGEGRGRVVDEGARLLPGVRFLKFDLCTGELRHIIHTFLQLTSPNLRILSLNLLSDESKTQLETLFQWACERLLDRRVVLHLSLLQRDAEIKRTTAVEYPSTSKSFERTLGKVEASFVSDWPLLSALFSPTSHYPMLTEVKFIQCAAVTNELLYAIALNCPHLRKLSLLSCSECNDSGVRHFIEFFTPRLSPLLRIVWKRDQRVQPRPANFFLNLINEYSHLLNGLKYRFACKTFSEESNGEAILIWRGDKMLVIQDYDDYDKNRVLGAVLPDPHQCQSISIIA